MKEFQAAQELVSDDFDLIEVQVSVAFNKLPHVFICQLQN